MRIYLLLLMVSMFSAVFSQTENYLDFIELNNGGKIKGHIKSFDSSDSIIIIVKDSTRLAFHSNEIKHFYVGYKSETLNEKGIYLKTNVGVMIGGNLDLYYTFPAKLNAVIGVGYHFNPYISTEISSGVSFFLDEFYAPITANFALSFRDRALSPYVNCNFGYSIPFDKENIQVDIWESYSLINFGGFTGGFELGVKKYNSVNNGYSVSVGYVFQQLNTLEKLEIQNETSHYKYNLNRVTLSVGFIFH